MECLHNCWHCGPVYIRLYSPTSLFHCEDMVSSGTLILYLLISLPQACSCCSVLWCSSMFKNGSDCAVGKLDIYASKLDWLIGKIVIPISLLCHLAGNLPIYQTSQTFHVIDIYGIYMYVWQILIVSWIILHVMAHTMKECLEVVKSMTILLGINSSVLISKPCACSYCANCRQLYFLFCTCAKTHAICLN
jgi:hypothetical protein